MKNIKFIEEAYEQFVEWASKDRKTFEKIDRLIRDISRSPFDGLGKPELLRYKKGWWSRRITQEHRIIYKIDGDDILIASVKGHYDD